MDRKPRTHEKKSYGQSVHVNKTDRVDTPHGPVGAGGRPGSGGSYNSSRPGGSSRPGPSRAARGGLISSPILLILAFLLLRGCGSFGSSQQSYYNTPSQTVVTQAPVVTAAPTQAPVVTQAPAATAAPVASAAQRSRFYTPLGGGRDTVTVMVYMCGTDLESSYGMATSDLQEVVSARIGSNVNVLVETGGCKLWKNKIVSNSTNQIYKVESGGVRLVKDAIGSKAMVKPDTLVEFIQFCNKNYPADRRILIFWDHGGGSVSGYGYDELYKASGSMDLAEIGQALKAAGTTFDWIGFDACLMATLETGMVCADYADYMIASEESEPGTGWYYTNWLTSLSNNTSLDTVTLGKQIVDDFISTSTKASASAKVSLSLVDLAQLQAAVPAPLRAFSTSTNRMIQNKEYGTVSNARAGARQFAQSSRINQIDLVDFANRIGTADAKALSQAILGCVKVNNTNISHAYGLSVYFPYESMNSVKAAVSTFNSVGMDAEYTKCITSFASLLSSGQVAASSSPYSGGSGGYGLDLTGLLNSYLGSSYPSGSSYSAGSSAYGSTNPLGALLGAASGSTQPPSSAGIDPTAIMSLLSAFSGRSMPAEMDWADTDLMARSAEFVAENLIDPADLVLTVRNDGSRVLSLTAEQWDLIQNVELNVFVDDGEGYLDMGLDNVDFDFDGDDLVMKYSGDWMCLNGVPVAYYLDSETDDEAGYTVRGHIPALLNGELVNLQVVFDDENPTGAVTGVQPMYDDGEIQVLAKGELALEQGDKLEFLADYYLYDGSYGGTYKIGTVLTVGAKGLDLSYEHLDETVSVTYRLTDIYNNHYWTPAWVQ